MYIHYGHVVYIIMAMGKWTIHKISSHVINIEWNLFSKKRKKNNRKKQEKQSKKNEENSG